MKKFLAIVMTLAMVISMMTVVSFAADVPYIGAKGEITVAPGAVVDVPVYITGANDANATYEIMQVNAYVPAEIPFELVAGSLTLVDVTLNSSNPQNIILYTDSAKTVGASSPVFYIRVTAPADEGKYTIPFGAYGDDSFLMDENYDLIGDVLVEDIVINVKQPAPSYKDGFYNLTTADNKASVTYFGTVGAATLYVATYNKVGTGLELVSVKTADIAAGTVAELTTVTTEAAAAGEVVKAFLWDADLNTVAVGTLAE